jgi:hypothetical protein
MIFSTIYLQAYLGMLEHTFAYMDRFHPAYGGWARLMKYHRTGSWH